MKPWEKYYAISKEELTKLSQELETAHLNNANSQTVIALNKKIAGLDSKCKIIEKYNEIAAKIADAEENAKNETNPQMKDLWLEELQILSAESIKAEAAIAQSLLSNKTESVMLEIRAGEGGQEASIFALELSNMYMKLCKQRQWEWRTMSVTYSEVGGLKEGIFEVTGNSVNNWLISESGVHCVKRVPKTEKKGRIHTSTATVATLIEPDDIEITINEKDLKIDVFRSSGPGGQSVNTTDSAVRITHIPTGLVVSQQDEKSQHKNKEKGMKILKARIYQKKLDEVHASLAQERKNAIGRAKRNERIRTYHFTQNWVNDTRVEKMCYNVANFMEGDALSEFLDTLIWQTLED